MLWLLSLLVFFALIFRTMQKDLDWETSNWGSRFGIVGLAAITTLIPTIVLGVTILLMSVIPATVAVADAPTPLVSLKERDGLQGSFFLGSGTIQDQQYYFWYARDTDGAIYGGKTVRDTDVRIYEMDGAAYMVTFHEEYKSLWVAQHWWLFMFDLREKRYAPQFYIPKGSIQEGYSL
jgi:hypothetical protein